MTKNLDSGVKAMEEVARVSAALLEKDLGYGRKRMTVVDIDTGEIIAEQHTGSVEAVFGAGANAIIKDVMIGREVNDSGNEFITISEPADSKVLFAFWRNPHGRRRSPTQDQPDKAPKHTGGKPTYLKLYTESLANLAEKVGDAEVGALFKLAQTANWKTGVLVDQRTKEPLDFEGLLHFCGYGSSATLARRLKGLREAGAVTVDDQGCYIISRQLLQKG